MAFTEFNRHPLALEDKSTHTVRQWCGHVA
jgi:hypothetical protein